MVPVSTVIAGITVVVTFHIRSIYTVGSLYCRTLPFPFLLTLLSPEVATSISLHVPFLLPCITMSGLLFERQQAIEALCYKPEGREFDSGWCHWNFSLT
jgi:hypothetical protein